MTGSPSLARSGRARHVPMRRCAGCGERSPQASMQRLGLTPAGTLEWRRAGGRGTYLHAKASCAERFVASRKMILGIRARVARSAREALIASAPSRMQCV